MGIQNIIKGRCNLCGANLEAIRKSKRFCANNCQAKCYNKNKSQSNILIKITQDFNPFSKYLEYRSRAEALYYICGYSGYIQKVKKEHYYSKIDGKFMANQWRRDGYAQREKQGNVRLSRKIAMTAQEGLDDEELARLL